MSNTKGTSQRQGYLNELYKFCTNFVNGIFKSLTKEQHCYTKSYHHPSPGATIRLDEASSGNKHAVFPNCKFLISCKKKVKQKRMPWNYFCKNELIRRKWHIFIHLLVSNVYLQTHSLLRGFPLTMVYSVYQSFSTRYCALQIPQIFPWGVLLQKCKSNLTPMPMQC